MNTGGRIRSRSSGSGLLGIVQNGFWLLWSNPGNRTNLSSIIPGEGSRCFLGGNLVGINIFAPHWKWATWHRTYNILSTFCSKGPKMCETWHKKLSRNKQQMSWVVVKMQQLFFISYRYILYYFIVVVCGSTTICVLYQYTLEDSHAIVQWRCHQQHHPTTINFLHIEMDPHPTPMSDSLSEMPTAWLKDSPMSSQRETTLDHLLMTAAPNPQRTGCIILFFWGVPLLVAVVVITIVSCW